MWCGTCLTSKLCDKIIKMPSKSRENVLLSQEWWSFFFISVGFQLNVLRNAKQLNIWNETKLNGIHETKPEKIYGTKRNFTYNETKQNFAVFLFRETSEILRNNLFVLHCFLFRETKKRKRNGNPTLKRYRYRLNFDARF
jgi:hypothetical protein